MFVHGRCIDRLGVRETPQLVPLSVFFKTGIEWSPALVRKSYEFESRVLQLLRHSGSPTDSIADAIPAISPAITPATPAATQHQFDDSFDAGANSSPCP